MIQQAFHILAVVTLLGASAKAGTLQLGSPTVESGRYIFPVILDGSDTPVAAMDFRFQFDPAVFRPVAADPGTMALQSDKTVTANAPAPGEYKVVMMGFNQTGVEGGEVARIALERIGAEGLGSSRVAVSDTTFSTWEGEEVASQGSERFVDLGGDASPEDPESPEEPSKPDELDHPAEEELPTAVPVDPSVGSSRGNSALNAGLPPADTAGPAGAAAARSASGSALARAFQDAAAARAQLETMAPSGELPEGTSNEVAEASGSSPSERVLVAQTGTKGERLSGIGSTESGIMTVESTSEEAMPQETEAPAAVGTTTVSGRGFWLAGMAGVGLAAVGLFFLRSRFLA